MYIRKSLSAFISFLLFFCVLPLSAQFGGSRGGSGPIATAGSGGSGRGITVGGRITPYRKISHTFSVDGYVDALLVSPGDRIKAGDPLIRLTRDVVGETYKPVILESRIDGIVSEVHVYESQQVSSGTPGVTVLDDRFFLLEASLSDRDARAVRSMMGFPVTGVSPEGDGFSGKIRDITTEPDYSTGLFTLTMQFPPRAGLYLGTVLFVDLPVEKASGITIERTALIPEQPEPAVWVFNSQGLLEMRQVTAGPEKEDKIEISLGISEGEQYVRLPDGREAEGMSVRELIQSRMAGNGSQGDR